MSIAPYLEQYDFKERLIPQGELGYSRSLAQDIFTRMCSELTAHVPRNCDFFVTWELAPGKGDVLHAIKVARILKAHFPHNRVQFIVEEDASVEKFMREHGFSETPIRPKEIYKEADTAPCVVFEVATPRMNCVRSDIAQLNQLREVHLIRIDEYNGWRYRGATLQSRIYSSGIGIIQGKKEFPIGIHVDRSLRCSADPALLDQLENVEVARQVKRDGDCKLYYAYYSINSDDRFYINRFVETIVRSERNNNRNLSFVVIFPEIDKHKQEEYIRAFAADIKQKIGDDEIAEIQFTKLHDPLYLGYTLNPEGKTVRIHFVKGLSHHDVLLLMQATERPVLVSGDQSWAEAVSMDKIVFYQKQSWKRELTKQMKRIGVAVSGPDSALSRFLGNVFKENKGKRNEFYVEPLAACLQEPDFGRQVTAFNDAICTHYDVTSRIVGMVCEIFAPVCFPRAWGSTRGDLKCAYEQQIVPARTKSTPMECDTPNRSENSIFSLRDFDRLLPMSNIKSLIIEPKHFDSIHYLLQTPKIMDWTIKKKDFDVLTYFIKNNLLKY